MAVRGAGSDIAHIAGEGSRGGAVNFAMRPGYASLTEDALENPAKSAQMETGGFVAEALLPCGSSAAAEGTAAAGGAKKLVSWYANPAAARAPRKAAAAGSEESRVWILEVCEDWRKCHICGEAETHTDTCDHPSKAKTNQVIRGFKLWELKSPDEPADGPTLGRYWFSNLDARPDDVDESEGMRVGEQRFTAWHRTHVKLHLRPGHYVRVQVRAGSKMHDRKWLRYVTIVDELAERDRAYEVLALAGASACQFAPAPAAPSSVKGKRERKTLKVEEASADEGPPRKGVPVIGTLGGAAGEAVLPEEVKVVGVSGRGRALKRREVVTLPDSDDDFASAPAGKCSKAAGSATKKKAPAATCKQDAATAATGVLGMPGSGVAVAVGVASASLVSFQNVPCTPQRMHAGVDGENRRLSTSSTAQKTLNATMDPDGVADAIMYFTSFQTSRRAEDGVEQGLSNTTGNHGVAGAGSSCAGHLPSPTGECCGRPVDVEDVRGGNIAVSVEGDRRLGGGRGRGRGAATAVSAVTAGSTQRCAASSALTPGAAQGSRTAEVVAGAAPLMKRLRGPYKKKGKAGGGGGAGVGVEIGAVASQGPVVVAPRGPVVVELSSDDEAEMSQASSGAAAHGRGDDVFELLLWMITVGDLGGGQTVFQLLSHPKNYLIKASILFGNDDRFSFKSAEEKGLVLSLAAPAGAIARELLNHDYTGTQDAHLKRCGTLENQGMTDYDFETLKFTLEKLRESRMRIKEEGMQVTGKKLGKFSYFCAICGKRFTFPVNDLVQHNSRRHGDLRQQQAIQASQFQARAAAAAAAAAGPRGACGGAGGGGCIGGEKGETGSVYRSAITAPVVAATADGGGAAEREVGGGREREGDGAIGALHHPCMSFTAGAGGSLPTAHHVSEQAYLGLEEAAVSHPGLEEAAATSACAAAGGEVGGGSSSWRWARDGSTGKLYYYNSSINVVQWQPPEPLALANPAAAAAAAAATNAQNEGF